MPRIIAGSAGSIPLQTPKGDRTRPTSDKAKEALFSMLAPDLPCDGFLDLFAGSGQIGLEAASRGCRHVVLVERDRHALACMQKNIEKTKLAAVVSVLRGDVFRQVKALKESRQTFSLIYLDPPYERALQDFKRLAPDLSCLLSAGGRLIFEHASRQQAPEFVTNLQLTRRCQYTAAMLSFYQPIQAD